MALKLEDGKLTCSTVTKNSRVASHSLLEGHQQTVEEYRDAEGGDVETPKASRVWGVGRGFPLTRGCSLRRSCVYVLCFNQDWF